MGFKSNEKGGIIKNYLFVHQMMIIFVVSKLTAMSIDEEGLNGREEYLEDLRFLLRHEEDLLKEGWYSKEDLDKLINEDCKGIVDSLIDE